MHLVKSPFKFAGKVYRAGEVELPAAIAESLELSGHVERAPETSAARAGENQASRSLDPEVGGGSPPPADGPITAVGSAYGHAGALAPQPREPESQESTGGETEGEKPSVADAGPGSADTGTKNTAAGEPAAVVARTPKPKTAVKKPAAKASTKANA